MTDSRSYAWPGTDDKTVVEEMIRDYLSEHWHECHEYIKKNIRKQAKNIPQDDWEDLAQNVMLQVHHSLPGFRHDCKLTTWLFQITRNSTIDTHRKLTNIGRVIASSDPHESVEHETDSSPGGIHEKPEDLSILREELSNAIDALKEYVATHANPERNGRILDIVIFEGSSLEKAAQAVGCSAAVAGYIVRQAQRFARGKRE
jgi:RNA polymerase sigma factor (sigma-70 family)